MSSPFSAGFAGGFAGQIFTSTFGDLLIPAHRALRQVANTWMPNELPDIGAIINCFNRGLLSQELCDTVCREHGVMFPNIRQDEVAYRNSLWKAVSKAHLSVPSPVEVIRANTMGLISNEQEALLLERSGGDLLPFAQMRKFYSSWLDESQLFVARNRNLIKPEQFRVGLRRLGLDHDGLPDVYDSLRHNMPGTGEILMLASKGIFDIPARTAEGMFAEMPYELSAMYEGLGFHEVAQSLPNSNINLQGATWGDLAWANHWSTLGIGPLTEMFHRFRGDRVAKFAADGLTVQPFDLGSTRSWFARNAIPPQMRDSLIAAGYRPLDRRVLLIGATTGEIQRPEAIEILKDSGLCSVDAERFADILDARVEYQNNAPIRAIEHGLTGRAFRAAVKAYEIGAFDRNKFTDAVSQLGVSTTAADGYADVIDSENLIAAINGVVKQLRRGYLNGSIDPFELSSLLSQAGISPARQQTYLVEWGALRTLERRTANTEKIMSWLVQGIMTADVAYSRLKNLGWTDVDALAYIVEASLKIAKRDAAIAQAGFRNAKANAAQLLRLQRQADTQVKQMQAEVRRLLPVGRLIKWYRQGSISEVYFENALRSQGYPDPVIAEYFTEAQKDGPITTVAKRQSSQPADGASVATGNSSATAAGPSTGTIEQNTPGPKSPTSGGPTTTK